MTLSRHVARPLLGAALLATAFAAAPALGQGGPPEGRGGGPPPHAGGPPPHAGGPDNRGQSMGAGDYRQGPGLDGGEWDGQDIARTVGDIIRDLLGYDPLALEPPADGGLPPGLANRDRLPPGLARQLRETGSLPPGLQRQLEGRIGDRTGYEVAIDRDTIRLIDPVTGDVDRVLDGILAFQRLLNGLDG